METVRGQCVDECSQLDYAWDGSQEWIADSLVCYQILFMVGAILLVLIARSTDDYLVQQENIVETLPPELKPLAGPLVAGLEQVADQAVMNVLEGEGDRLYFQDGNLVVDFNDVYNYIEDRFGISDLNLVPQAVEGRLGLFNSYQVAVLQEVVSYLNTFGLLLPLLTIVVFVAAVWVSLWRRQTTMWIGIATTIAMFISLIVFSGARSSALTSVQDPFLRELGRAILNVLTHGLMVQTLFLMIVGVLLIIGAWQAAPDSALMKWEAAWKEQEVAQT